jgi:WD40 repeat protein
MELRDFAWGYYHRLANRERGTLKGHAGAIGALALSPDGGTLASAGPDKKGATQVWLWNIREAKARRSFTCRGADVSALAFSPDGNLLAVAVNTPAEVTLWKVHEPGQPRSLPGPPPIVAGVAFTADGLLVSAAGEGVKVWEVASGKQKASWADAPAKHLSSPLEGPVVSYSSDGRRVATGVEVVARPDKPVPETYPVRVFDVVAGKKILELTPKSGLTQLVLSPDGHRLAVLSLELALLWDLRQPEPRSRPLPFQGFSPLFSPDGRTLACLSMWAKDPASVGVTLWDVEAWSERQRIRGMGYPGMFVHDGKGLFVVQKRKVTLHDTQTGRTVLAVDHNEGGGVSSVFVARFLARTPDARTLVVAVTPQVWPNSSNVPSGVIHLWSLVPTVGTREGSIGGERVRGWLTLDGKEMVIVTGIDPVRIERRSVANQGILSKIELSITVAKGLLLGSPDGAYILTRQSARAKEKRGNTSGFLVIDTRVGHEDARIQFPPIPLGRWTERPLAFRADGKVIAFARASAGPSSPSALSLYAVPQGTLLQHVPLKNVHGLLRSCVFSPNGRAAAVETFGDPPGTCEVGIVDFETEKYRTVGSVEGGLLRGNDMEPGWKTVGLRERCRCSRLGAGRNGT